ncbi:MAG: GtrA family protein [Anaerolineae bacterium]|nr:GtrA family protein [Anaerolineae bacterium]
MTSQAGMTDTQPKKRTSHSIETPIDSLIRGVARRVGGSRAREVERFIKFAIVGTIGFIVDFGTMYMLQATILPPVSPAGEHLSLNVGIAQTISFIAAVTSNFIWNRLWTYPDSRSSSIRRQLGKFTLVSISGWLVRSTWMTLAYLPIGTLLYPVLSNFALYAGLPTEEATAKMGSHVALFIGVFVVMIWNFFANRYWTYGDVS